MKNKKEQTQAVGYKELYDKGKLNYIIKYGVLSWGVSLTIIVRIMIGFYQYKLNLQKVSQSLFSKDTIYTLITFSIFGAIWGRIMWVWLEREVKKIESAKIKKTHNKKHKKSRK